MLVRPIWEEDELALDPQARAFIDLLGDEPSFDEIGVIEARVRARGFEDFQDDPAEIAVVTDLLVPGPAGPLPVRVYNPAGDRRLPLLVYFHGGGWTIGGIETVDVPCRALAAAADCVVASVGYRRAPESKFPGPVEDCYAATVWVAENAAKLGADGSPLTVAGDSAGGNLAAAVALVARDRGGPRIARQFLFYPVLAPAVDSPFASYRENAEGYMLSRRDMLWFWDNYLSAPEEGALPYASPLLADDLSGLPPAFISVAEYDPLRDEGLAYAERLREAGVEVRADVAAGGVHGSLWLTGVLDAGNRLIAEAADVLRTAPALQESAR